LIREALHPYPKDVHIVTKVGASRAPDKSWPVALSREELTSSVHDNLKHLGLETLDVVNLRVGGLERPTPGSIAEPFTVLAELRRRGLIRGQQRAGRAAHRGAFHRTGRLRAEQLQRRTR